MSYSKIDAGSKWFALIDDVVVPLPQRRLSELVIRDQAEVPSDEVLVRDHNSPNDNPIDDGEAVDLGEGNVFYRLKRCDVVERSRCTDPPKLAFLLNDHPETTTRANQSGTTLRMLFGLPEHAKLLRDTEGPEDDPVALDDFANFQDGPVFISRQQEAKLTIIVNGRRFTEHDGVTNRMTGLAIAALAYPEAPDCTVVKWISEGDRVVSHGETIEIQSCSEFEVTRKNVVGGYVDERVERELAILAEGNIKATYIPAPINAVIYHGLRAKLDGQTLVTDVLVPIPPGYPAQYIDWVYLPEGSQLLGHLPGSPQDQRVEALGTRWQQVSYHPHNGGGGAPWNPGVHGFHTYLGEVMSWLNFV